MVELTTAMDNNPKKKKKNSGGTGDSGASDGCMVPAKGGVGEGWG